MYSVQQNQEKNLVLSLTLVLETTGSHCVVTTKLVPWSRRLTKELMTHLFFVSGWRENKGNSTQKTQNVTFLLWAKSPYTSSHMNILGLAEKNNELWGCREGDIVRMKELKEKAGAGKASGWSVMEDNPDYLWQEDALIHSSTLTRHGFFFQKSIKVMLMYKQ